MYKNQYISELPINEVKKYFDELRCNTPWTAEQFADFEMCKERLTVYACKTLEQTEWIPVSERLPENTGLYLISIGDLVTTASFDGHNFRTQTMVRFIPDAWLSLPKPYKAESEAAEI